MENKRHSIRLYHRNYSQPGYYFVTIDSYKHQLLFGKIIKADFIPNQIGKILQKWLQNIPFKFPSVSINTYQIMPNHVHLIILISGQFCVRANHDSPTIEKRQLLPKIIGYIKMNSAKEAQQQIWHRNYYEHIIRHKIELEKYRLYIGHNPKDSIYNQP